MRKTTLLKLFAAFAVVLSTACQVYAIDANALPNVVGSVNVQNTIDSTNKTLTSTIKGGANAVGQNDMTGGLGSNGTWNINASAHSQTFLGRFIDGKLTELNGKINTGCASGAGCGYDSTLKVILTNPYGITFGNGSQVNANSFTVSTFDAEGAKNIKNMSASELEAYKNSLTSKFGPNVDIKFEGGSKTDGAAVTLNGSTWNIDKTAAIVAKDINVYKGSKISTNLNYNYGNNQNFSNLKLITTDGVIFKYAANGYMNNGNAQILAAKSDVDYKINIGDKNSTNATDAELHSGNVHIINMGKTDNSTVKVAKSAIKGYKLINNAYGDIYLVGNDVSVNDSLLETHNTHEADNTSKNTYSKVGGSIVVQANKGIGINNSTIKTAYSTVKDESGDVIMDVSKTGNINITNSTVNSKGLVSATANDGNVNITNSVLVAKNKTGSGQKEDMVLFGKKGVKVEDSNLDADQDVTIKSTAGNVNLVDNGKIKAGNKLTIIGKNSLIEGSALSYNAIALHDGTNTNNVTIKDTTTLQDNGSTDGLKLDVKGNLTIDNNSLKTRTPGDKYADATNQNKIALNATGNITIQNNSDITSSTNTNINAQNNVNIKNSKLTAENNTIVAAAGSINLDKANIKANKNNTLTAKKDVNSECSELDAQNNAVTAQTGAIDLKNTKAKATKNNNLVAKTNVKTANVRISGDNNIVTAQTGNAELTNTEVQGKTKNTITANKGNVTFKFDKDLQKACEGNGCLDVVQENKVEAKANDIIADEGNIEIKGAKITATEGDNTIKAPTGSIRIENTKVKAAKNNNIVAADDVDTECAELEAENNIVTAQNGKVTMSNTQVKATKNNTITANKNVKTANVRINGGNNTIKSKSANVEIVNTDIQAKNKNLIVADKGSVTFKFDKDLQKACEGNGCLEAVTKNNIKGKENNIKADEDVVIDTTITPDDETKPEDTITTIEGKNITTGAKVVYDDLFDTTGTIVGDGQLDTKGTKIKLVTPGNINLVLKNANNKKAGLELDGSKVEIKTRDGQLAISKIYADELYLDQDEKFIAGTTTITDAEKAVDSFASTNPAELSNQAGFDSNLPGRAYIEVKDGFNFDWEPSQVAVNGIYQGSFNEIKNADGEIIGYGKHYITLDKNTTEGQFLLTYNKPFACEEPPVIMPDVDYSRGYLDDQTALTKIPLQAAMLGNAGPIQNGTTDPSISMIAAAAAVNVEDDEQLDY
ncbi:MAG: hypothetical protein E7Z91_00360 [Cyanobacteria bacterium SIG30]|nr:hypothetical protein [Cyanobacteria bacterium SIG30]